MKKVLLSAFLLMGCTHAQNIKHEHSKVVTNQKVFKAQEPNYLQESGEDMSLKTRVTTGLAGIVTATALAGPAQAAASAPQGHEVPNFSDYKKVGTIQVDQNNDPSDGKETTVLKMQHKTDENKSMLLYAYGDSIKANLRNVYALADVTAGDKDNSKVYFNEDCKYGGISHFETETPGNTKVTIPACYEKAAVQTNPDGFEVPDVDSSRLLGEKEKTTSSGYEVTLRGYINDNSGSKFNTVSPKGKKDPFAYILKDKKEVLLDSNCDGKFESKYPEGKEFEIPACAYK